MTRALSPLLEALDTELAQQPTNPPFRPVAAADWPTAALIAERNGYHAYTVIGDNEWATMYPVRLGATMERW